MIMADAQVIQRIQRYAFIVVKMAEYRDIETFRILKVTRSFIYKDGKEQVTEDGNIPPVLKHKV